MGIAKCGYHHHHHHHHHDRPIKDAGLEVCSACKFRESGYSSPCTAACILMMMIMMATNLTTMMINHDFEDDDNFLGCVDDNHESSLRMVAITEMTKTISMIMVKCQLLPSNYDDNDDDDDFIVATA